VQTPPRGGPQTTRPHPTARRGLVLGRASPAWLDVERAAPGVRDDHFERIAQLLGAHGRPRGCRATTRRCGESVPRPREGDEGTGRAAVGDFASRRRPPRAVNPRAIVSIGAWTPLSPREMTSGSSTRKSVPNITARARGRVCRISTSVAGGPSTVAWSYRSYSRAWLLLVERAATTAAARTTPQARRVDAREPARTRARRPPPVWERDRGPRPARDPRTVPLLPRAHPPG
jgi:hypothetical protein